jgi:SET domain-containing protein
MGWIADVEFRKSPIHGMGIFAKTRIPAGARIWEFDDSMQASRLPDLAALSPEELEYALLAGYLHQPSGRFIWYKDGMQYMNHADSPHANIGLNEWLPLQEDHCIALRDIEAGEELMEDYSFWSVCSLDQEHWLPKLYRDFCYDHYSFLTSLERRRRAA